MQFHRLEFSNVHTIVSQQVCRTRVGTIHLKYTKMQYLKSISKPSTEIIDIPQCNRKYCKIFEAEHLKRINLLEDVQKLATFVTKTLGISYYTILYRKTACFNFWGKHNWGQFSQNVPSLCRRCYHTHINLSVNKRGKN